ncbi:hypothetical protein KM043_002762 [Ampulex compressa]|nr:hypothetical protein KM043_002762 [Ampulex compressa]
MPRYLLEHGFERQGREEPPPWRSDFIERGPEKSASSKWPGYPARRPLQFRDHSDGCARLVRSMAPPPICSLPLSLFHQRNIYIGKALLGEGCALLPRRLLHRHHRHHHPQHPTYLGDDGPVPQAERR